MTSEGIPTTLKTPQPMTTQRRGSFLYRSEVSDEATPQQAQQQFLATPSISTKSHSNTSSVSASPTPDQRRRRSSNYNTDPTREYNYSISSSSATSRYPEEFCLEILDDLDWCLDQLEAIQTNKSVGDLASIKFKKILTKELNQLAESSKSGSLISEYISNTFFDKEDEGVHLENESVVIQVPAAFSGVSSALAAHTNEISEAASSSSSFTTSTTSTAAAAPVARNAIMCDIPGVKKVDSSSLDGEQEVQLFGVSGLDEKRVKERLVGLSSWNFDIFKLDEITSKNSLVVTALTIFRERNLLTAFCIPHDSIVTYFRRIQAHYYLDNFYHNRMHAADVTHAVHVMLNKAPQLAILSDLEILSVLFAAVIHDVDHPGLTNPYLINTNADLALMYNDESVLENHHLAVAFKLLQEVNSDIFVNVPSRTRQRMRKMVIDMVLATDMTKHMSLLADLKTKVETKKLSGADLLVTDNYNDRMEVLKCLLHCADLGNPTKDLCIYNQWVDRIMKEFFNQGDIERNQGLEISPMCDRYTASIEKSQVSFIEYIVHPLWETWAELVDPYCNDIVDVIEQNKKHFESLAAQKCTSPVLRPVGHDDIDRQWNREKKAAFSFDVSQQQQQEQQETASEPESPCVVTEVTITINRE